MDNATSLPRATSTENTFFIPLRDTEVPEKFKELVLKWRKFATDLGYTGSLVWRVHEGFTLKDHAPLAGPCRHDFNFMKSWEMKNDKPTKSAYVFFIPRVIEGSTQKEVKKQMAVMVETRKRYGLPEHHLASFGSAGMISGLVLANLKYTGDKSSLDRYVVRTDTFRSEPYSRLRLDIRADRLSCDWFGWDYERRLSLGIFPLGVELDPPAHTGGL